MSKCSRVQPLPSISTMSMPSKFKATRPPGRATTTMPLSAAGSPTGLMSSNPRVSTAASHDPASPHLLISSEADGGPRDLALLPSCPVVDTGPLRGDVIKPQQKHLHKRGLVTATPRIDGMCSHNELTGFHAHLQAAFLGRECALRVAPIARASHVNTIACRPQGIHA